MFGITAVGCEPSGMLGWYPAQKHSRFPGGPPAMMLAPSTEMFRSSLKMTLSAPHAQVLVQSLLTAEHWVSSDHSRFISKLGCCQHVTHNTEAVFYSGNTETSVRLQHVRLQVCERDICITTASVPAPPHTQVMLSPPSGPLIWL